MHIIYSKVSQDIKNEQMIYEYHKMDIKEYEALEGLVENFEIGKNSL